ncbi:MAG: tetratricopeptide repeat protein, partial [Bacillota bacterium]|nr:tetratricopeptide repeat protein [Bacillota bacterium]
ILSNFLKQLHSKKRGILRIVSNQGCGATSFLNIASNIALKHNYEVININEYSFGKSIDKLKTRNINDFQNLKNHVYKKIIDSKKDGQIIIIDIIDQIDNDTLSILNKLLSSETDITLALIYSTNSNLTTNIDYIDIPIYKTIFLEPLSPKGLQQLMKTTLVGYKPPDILLEYLYNKTKGLPKYILTEIEFLIKEDILIYDSNNGWITNEEYLSTLVNKVRYKNNFLPRNNLPTETTQFVGRKDEIRKICALLEEARLVTLIGPGGIGKSRLSLKVALICLSKFTDGVFWIPLSQITKTELLISNIAKILNIPEIEGHNTLDAIKSTLKSKRLLIILDNFEQIIDSVSVLADLLSIAANLSLLVTSRQPLKIYGEHLYSVPPLEIPDINSDLTVEFLEKQPAVSLFLARARAIKNDFNITEENASQIAKLCACLEGIPLAIELAAANISQISIQTMLNQSQNRLSWLIDGSNSLPDRQWTMKNTIEWGYNLLSANQKRIFMRLGVFKGKFNIKAISAVINKNNDIENLYEDLLSLTNKSMLMLDSEFEQRDKLCFNMLEILREYAVLLLSTDSDEKFIKECHADYFYSCAIDAANNFYGSNRQTSINTLDQAYLDIICALEYYMATGCLEKELELAVAMGYYWEARGYWDKGQSILRSVIEKQDNSLDMNYYIKAYQWLGRFVFLNGDYEDAVNIFEQGLILAMERNDLISEAAIRYNLALTYNISGNLKYEVELLNQSLSVFRQAGFKRGIAEVLQELGQVYYFKGSYETAESCLNESLDIYNEYNDTYGILRSYGRMGLVLRGKGEFELAMEMFHKYLFACEKIDNRVEIAFALINIAELARSQGDYAVAESYYLRGLNLGYKLGYMAIIACIKKDLGEICHYMGDLNKSYELFNESLTILHETGHKGDAPWVYRNMAELELERGNYLKAEELFLIGLKLYIEIKQNTLSYIFLVFEGLATVSTMLEDYNRAACLYSAANKLFQTVGNLLAVNDINSFKTRLDTIRSMMDTAAFESSWSEGYSMSLEHVIRYALKDNKYDRAMANKMINYINENYEKDISLNDISEYFNMSNSYLSTMFKYYTGQNFKDYLNLCRVKASKELMRKNSSLRINEIATKVGCNGAVTFIRMFRKYEGLSPGQYYSDLKINKKK